MIRPLLFGALSSILLVACGGGVDTTTGTSGAGGATTMTSVTSSTSGSTTTASSTSSTSSNASSGTGGVACPPACEQGFACCGGACVNKQNDIHNCGTCGTMCLGENPFCGNGVCQDPPCSGVSVCKGAQFCCGTECCEGGMLCCEVPGPGPSGGAKCTAPENGTCPLGCPLCK